MNNTPGGPDEDRGMQGEQETLKQKVEDNMALVYAMARRLNIPEGDRDDVLQAGFVGLTQAVHRFDPQRGVKFSTYAVPFILGEMRQQLRKRHMLHIGRRDQSRSALVLRTHERLEQTLGRRPTLAELARACALAPEEAAAALEMMVPVNSMEAQLEQRGEAGDFSDGSSMEEETLTSLAAREALARLGERQRSQLVKARAGALSPEHVGLIAAESPGCDSLHLPGAGIAA